VSDRLGIKLRSGTTVSFLNVTPTLAGGCGGVVKNISRSASLTNLCFIVCTSNGQDIAIVYFSRPNARKNIGNLVQEDFIFETEYPVVLPQRRQKGLAFMV